MRLCSLRRLGTAVVGLSLVAAGPIAHAQVGARTADLPVVAPVMAGGARGEPEPALPLGPAGELLWCATGVGSTPTEGVGPGGPLPVARTLAEIEPNDDQPGQPVLLNLNERVVVTGATPAGVFDVDVFAVDLLKGDVLQVVAVRTAGEVNPFVVVKDGDLLGLSAASTVPFAARSTIVPFPSPLFTIQTEEDDFTSAESVIAERDGVHTVTVAPITTPAANLGYTLHLTRVRPGFESAPAGSNQILFLDFDGEAVAFGDPNDPLLPPTTALSPLSAFLPAWGLSPADEDAVIDAVRARVIDLFEGVRALNPAFDFEVRTSRDHPDTFDAVGRADLVTKCILGGTIAEAGVGTIGRAGEIDVGNFNAVARPFVLLDVISSPTNPVSLNLIPRAPGFTMIDLIGRVLGTLVAHEIGHTLGGFHTSSTNTQRSIMDRGTTAANFPRAFYGVGADGVAGNADDEDIRFVPDDFALEEGMQGVERTDFLMAMAMTTPAALCPADLNGDGAVGGADIATILNAFGVTGTGLPADLNGDGAVNGGDIANILNAFGPCPPALPGP